MDYKIKYARVKHGWIRLMPDMTLKLTIPLSKSHDKEFENILLEKWKKLLLKYKSKNVQKLETITDKYVIVFWEKILLNEISWNIEIYLKQKLYDTSLPILNKYSAYLWIDYNKLHIKDLKTKWWSCSWIQNISLNLKIVHLPIKFLEYVIVHEACHLKEKNHQKKFWDLVLKYSVDYKDIRKELKSVRI